MTLLVITHSIARMYGAKIVPKVTWLEAGVIKWTLILQVVPPTKFGRAKNVQNSARFLTTFDFDRECLRNASTCRKSEYHLINYISSRIRRKKWANFGPLTKKL